MIDLRLAHRSREEMEHKGLTLHGFWDNEAVMANLPPLSPALRNEERYQRLQYFQDRLIGQLANQPPPSWRTPVGVALKNYGEQWADDILPVARQAHQRLRFVYMHATADQGRIVVAGDARENPSPDGVAYGDWAAGIVRDELHRAGWRLADLLTEAVGSPANSAVAIPAP